MIILLVLLAAQAVEQDAQVPDSKVWIAVVNDISEREFKCLDLQIKIHLNKHVEDATPEVVVSNALLSCQHLKFEYKAAINSREPFFFSPEKSTELANHWERTFHDTYVKHVDKLLAKPEIAEGRSKLIIQLWRKCVQEKAVEWSRLSDAADTIGMAAVTSCATHNANLQSAMRYELRSKGLPENRSSEIADRLQIKMKEVATEAVISRRAKRLSGSRARR